MEKKEWNSELNKYIKLGEPSRVVKTKSWKTAIGLQEVDNLKPSEYLIQNIKEHIEGNIDLPEVEKRIKKYYKAVDKRKQEDESDTEEADKVSIQISSILSEKSFTFSPLELVSIHKRLFSDVYSHAGKIRDYDFIKEEWVLNGDTVTYAPYEMINAELKYDFEVEKEFSYKEISFDKAIKHIARFTSNIWQVHPFSEGNTRTVAVFIIKYLKTFGFDINYEVFVNNSWYFRNALVRANYNNYEKNIFEDISFLEKFFYNLIGGKKYELKNRYVHMDNVNNSDVSFNEDITIEEQAIINVIKNNASVSQEDIANIIGKSVRTIKSRMSVMQEKGLITRTNGKRDGKWIVNDVNNISESVL